MRWQRYALTHTRTFSAYHEHIRPRRWFVFCCNKQNRYMTQNHAYFDRGSIKEKYNTLYFCTKWPPKVRDEKGPFTWGNQEKRKKTVHRTVWNGEKRRCARSHPHIFFVGVKNGVHKMTITRGEVLAVSWDANKIWSMWSIVDVTKTSSHLCGVLRHTRWHCLMPGRENGHNVIHVLLIIHHHHVCNPFNVPNLLLP